MKFVENIEKEIYENFCSNNELKSHFLQSYKWGEFCKVQKGLTPYYVGLKDNNNLVCVALLLEKKMPLGLKYFYSPRGFVMDLYDAELLKAFTDEINKFLRKKKALFLKVDPDIIINSINYKDEKNVLLKDGMNVYKNFLDLGYKHLGFTKLFESSQPRYTFRINMQKDEKDIEQCFSKTTIQRIKKAEELGVNSFIGNRENIKDFYNLMLLTEKRKGIINHDENYYRDLYDLFNKDNQCNLFIGKVNLPSIINKYNIILKQIDEELINFKNVNELSKSQKNKKNELEIRKNKLISDINEYTKYRKQYGEEIILNGHFIIEYAKKAWVLYAGNHDILSETGSNYLVYRDHIKYYHDKGIKIYDQFGTVGDLTNKSLLGLHEFKKKFGGDYVEFVGEFVYVYNKPLYFIYTKLIPYYRKIFKKLLKIKRKNEN